MFGLALLAVGHSQPRSFDDVQKLMYTDARKLKGYSDTWAFTQPDGETKISYDRKVDGNKAYLKVVVNGKPMLMSCHDGKARGIVNFSEKMFASENAKNTSFTAPYKPESEKSGSGTLNVAFVDAYDLSITCTPPFALSGIKSGRENGKQVRVVTALASNPDTGGKVTFELILEMDRWVPLRFGVSIKSKDGKVRSFEGKRTSFSENQKFQISDFQVDSFGAKGFKRVPFPKYEG